MTDITFPGEKIAIIEEYESGKNTFDDGHMVRSAVVGTPDLNKKERTAQVQNFKQLSIPQVNDIIIGTVAAVMSSMIAIMILYVNGKPVKSHVECICNTRNIRKKSVALVNDIVIGTVAAVMSSMIAVMILYVNGKPVKSHVECICNTRNIRKKSVALVNDIVKLKIIGHLNGAIHATISEPDLCVLFTKCKKCGGSVIPMHDAIKCVECAWIDERKLSVDFGNYDFIKL
ncbi:MAG: hypothetical protein Q8Q69_06385, partial [Nitrosopumilaceae archaeon]|nr:hypothetical protein [Nitrosopumilaceae archaeon]